MMFRVILCVVGFVAVQAVTVATTTHKPHVTHHPHSTSEPGEKDNIRFVYEAHSHEMLVVNNHACYLFTLSDSERIAVHTDVGMRTLELKLLNLIGTSTTTEVMLKDQTHAIQRSCGHVQHVYTVA